MNQKQHEQNNAQEILAIAVALVLIDAYFFLLNSLQDRIAY